MTVWGKDQVKIPLEFRLYPKASILGMVIVGYLTLYSYGGASELIYTNFSDTNMMRPIFLLITQTGIPFLSGTAMIDFNRLLINKFALYYGNNEEKMAAQLNAMIDQLKTGISLMDGEKLIASLAILPKATLSKLGITEQELRDTREKLSGIETENKAKAVKVSVINKKRSPTPTEETPLLPRRPGASPPPSSCCGCFSRFFKRLRGEPEINNNVGQTIHRSKTRTLI